MLHFLHIVGKLVQNYNHKRRYYTSQYNKDKIRMYLMLLFLFKEHIIKKNIMHNINKLKLKSGERVIRAKILNFFHCRAQPAILAYCRSLGNYSWKGFLISNGWMFILVVKSFNKVGYLLIFFIIWAKEISFPCH